VGKVNIPDNYDMWESHELEKERRLAMLPICDYCGHTIQDEHYYLINGDVVCCECLDTNFKVPNFID
jgi:formylmethanofuran dehydrogenase subunit E